MGGLRVGDHDGTGVELAIAKAPVRLKRIVQREPLDVRRDHAGPVEGDHLMEVLDRSPVRIGERRLVGIREERPLRGSASDPDDLDGATLGDGGLGERDRRAGADEVERGIDASSCGQLADLIGLVGAAFDRDGTELAGTRPGLGTVPL